MSSETEDLIGFLMYFDDNSWSRKSKSLSDEITTDILFKNLIYRSELIKIDWSFSIWSLPVRE